MAFQRHILSKSTFLYGCQCDKRLFLHKFRPKLKNPADPAQQSVFQMGTSIGELARNLFPGGVDASPPDPFSYHLSVAKTQELIQSGQKIIYEAAFIHEGVLCALDILVNQNGKWLGYEVKGSTSVKDIFIQDIAFQYYVITNSGLELGDISLIYINNTYIRKGALDVPALFARQSILDEVRTKQVFISEKISALKTLLEQKKEPVIDIGAHCFNPYECDFTAHCWSHVPKENSVFDLVRGKGFELYEKGYKHLNDLPANCELTGAAGLQLAHYRSGEILTEKDKLKEFITNLSYPLYFIDFETIMPGIPEFDNSRPYQQIPFQFSLHKQEKKGSGSEHFEFLGDGISDSRKALAEALIKSIGKSGTLLAYNKSFEVSRLNELAELFPEHAEVLSSFAERMQDLMTPFQKHWYYHPEFKGSYSIKSVLPVMIPELSYADLAIREGATAGLVYSNLKNQSPALQSLQRKQLLEYCKLDTWAMVNILEKLEKEIESQV